MIVNKVVVFQAVSHNMVIWVVKFSREAFHIKKGQGFDPSASNLKKLLKFMFSKKAIKIEGYYILSN